MQVAMGLLAMVAAAAFLLFAGRPAMAADGDVLFAWTPGDGTLKTAEGAKAVDCPTGKAMAGGGDGGIASGDVKLGEIPEKGAISFWIKLDRLIRVAPKSERVEAKLIACEDLTIYLRENDNGCTFRIEGGNEIRRPRVPGLANMDLTHLRPNQWYHVVITYDAPAGNWRMILNGVRQPAPYRFGAFRWRHKTAHIEFNGLMKPAEGKGKPARVALGPVTWTAGPVEAADVLAGLKKLKGWKIPENLGEGLLIGTQDFDGEALGGEIIYQNGFDKPLDMENEWVLEGPAKVEVKDGRLLLHSRRKMHAVLWLKKKLPRDFVAAWDFQPQQIEGLTIVFLGAMGADGRDLFDPTLAPRDGDFKQYIRGDIRCYHASYWAGTRGSANMRKNPGFYIVGIGEDLIYSAMTTGKKGPFRVVLVRKGNRIQLAVNKKRFILFEEDGKLYGPPHGAGYFGLRQMKHSKRVAYDNLVIRTLKP